MRIQLLLIVHIWLFIGSMPSFAQDQWIGAVPLQYNPSFAGSAGEARICSYTFFNSRKFAYYPASNDFAQTVAFDQFVSKLSSGIGLNLGYQNRTVLYMGIDIPHFFTELTIAPKISLKGKYTLSPAVSGAYNYYRSSVPSYIDNFRSSRFTIRGSLLLNSKKFYLGYCIAGAQVYNFHSNDGGFYFGTDIKYFHYFQAGYAFQQSEDSKFSFTPQVLVMTRMQPPKESNVLGILNLNFRYKMAVFGIGNRHYMLGLQKERFKLMLIYQYRFNKIDRSPVSIGDRNLSLSLRYHFGEKE